MSKQTRVISRLKEVLERKTGSETAYLKGRRNACIEDLVSLDEKLSALDEEIDELKFSIALLETYGE